MNCSLLHVKVRATRPCSVGMKAFQIPPEGHIAICLSARTTGNAIVITAGNPTSV